MLAKNKRSTGKIANCESERMILNMIYIDIFMKGEDIIIINKLKIDLLLNEASC
jgi:hypothetical protein